MRISQKTQRQIESFYLQGGSFTGLRMDCAAPDADTLHLLVGLGGQGCDLLREAKGQVNSLCRDDVDGTKPPRRVVYLGIDTDTAPSGALKSSWTCSNGPQVRLEEKEQCFLPMMLWVPPEPEWTIRSWYEQRHVHPMPHGDRQQGRVALFLNMEQVCQKIQTALTGIGGPVVRAHVYLLTGVSGGTGGGIYLDMAYILRQALQHILHLHPASVQVYGYLLMPRISQYLALQYGQNAEVPVSNGYAALRELDHLMDMKRTGDRFCQEYPAGVVVDTDDPPFDCVHLIGEGMLRMFQRFDYRDTLAAAARNIRSFIAPESPSPTGPWGYSSMADVYTQIPSLVHTAMTEQKPFPERSYRYQTLGSAEFALPGDLYHKLQLTALLQQLGPLRQKEPSAQDMKEIMRQLELELPQWIWKLTAGIQAPFVAECFGVRDAFGAGAEELNRAELERALDAAESTLRERFVREKKTFEERVCAVLTDAVRSVETGPFWVNSLLADWLPDAVRMEQQRAFNALPSLEHAGEDLRRQQETLHQGVLHTKGKAQRYAHSLNEQFRCELEKMAILFFCQSVSGDPEEGICMAEHGYCVLRDWLASRVGPAAEMLGAFIETAERNDSVISKPDGPYSLGVDPVPYLYDRLKNQVPPSGEQNCLECLWDVVQESLSVQQEPDALVLAERWIRWLQAKLRRPTLEDQLSMLLGYDRHGPRFQSTVWQLLRDLAHQADGRLRAEGAKPGYCYIISVPDDCPVLQQCAFDFMNHHMGAFLGDFHGTVRLQHSHIRDRISVQCVPCVLGLYQYSYLPQFEYHYFSLPQDRRAGTVLRVSADPQLDWRQLPSPIPDRARSPGMEQVHPEVHRLEQERRELFRQLLKRGAICLLPGVGVDCFLFSIPDPEQTELWNLPRTIAGWKQFESMLRDGLHQHVPDAVRRTVLEDCDRYADPVQWARNPDNARLAIAEEFFVASLTLCAHGEETLIRHRKLEERIGNPETVPAEN